MLGKICCHEIHAPYPWVPLTAFEPVPSLPGRQETTSDYDILVEIPWGKSRADRKVEQKGLARAPMMTTLLLMLIRGNDDEDEG